MVALGLILLVVSGAFTLGVVLSNTDTTAAEAFGVSLSNVTIGGLFLAGAVAGLVFMLGLALLAAGAGRSRRKKVATKRTVRGVRSEKEQLEAENSELKAKLAAEPAAAYPAGHDDATHAATRVDTHADTRTDGYASSDAARSDAATSDSAAYPPASMGSAESTTSTDNRPARSGLFGRH